MNFTGEAVAKGNGFTVFPTHITNQLSTEHLKQFYIGIPRHWQSQVTKNPHAFETQNEILRWFSSLNCSDAELARAKRFDISGYIGIPFPNIALEKLVLIGKHLSMWLLWDDVHVESLIHHWKIRAQDVLSNQRPPNFTRFDEGWWEIFQEFARNRTQEWMGRLCESMTQWSNAAVDEALLFRQYYEKGIYPSFDKQLRLRVETIGMFPTILLFEDAYDFEFPADLHLHHTVMRLKWLAGLLVSIGNDVFSFGKDCVESKLNLISTLMHENSLNVESALQKLIQMHDEAIIEFDQLAKTLINAWPCEIEQTILLRWIQDLRYASIGFTLWEAQAPRYSEFAIILDNRKLSVQIEYI